MEEIRISAERIQELASMPGAAFVLKEGRWKFTTWTTVLWSRKRNI